MAPKALKQAERMVGLGGLEPPTSRLSSARSNQLSYKPEPLRSRIAQAMARPERKRNEDGGMSRKMQPDGLLMFQVI